MGVQTFFVHPSISPKSAESFKTEKSTEQKEGWKNAFAKKMLQKNFKSVFFLNENF
jgi:hypothetical protein